MDAARGADRAALPQAWFDLSDPAAAEALYESPTVRTFVGVDLGRDPAPDETTIRRAVARQRPLLDRWRAAPDRR